MVALFTICLIFVGMVPILAQNPDPNWSHEEYLNWLYTNFRSEFWSLGLSTRQFAVVTVERLTNYPQVDAEVLPLQNPEEWNAAYYAYTAPDHTEPALFESLRNMIINHLQVTHHLPTNIYLFTYNIPCPLCTTTMMDYIRIYIPNTIRAYIHTNTQYNYALQELGNINYRFAWNSERGNRIYARATMEEFDDTNDDGDAPGLTYYPRLLVNPSYVCYLNNFGRKKRDFFVVIHANPRLTTKWRQMTLNWKHVSAGVGGVWGVGPTGNVFYRGGTYEDSSSAGSDWQSLGGLPMTQLSVGHNTVWAVDSSDRIYRREGITAQTPTGASWTVINGLLKQISVSPKGNVWGVNSNGQVYKRAGDSWTFVSGLPIMNQVTVGSAGVWAISPTGTISYRTDTFEDMDSVGFDWVEIPGLLKCISSGGGLLWGVNRNDNIFYRLGQSYENPLGTAWIPVGGKLKQLSVSDRGIWGVNSVSYAYGRLSTFGFDLDGWVVIPKKATHISTGFAGVWIIDENGFIYYRQSTYAAGSNSEGSGAWEIVDGILVQLDVGHRVVWGVNSNGNVFFRRGISMLKQIGTHWESIPSLALKHVSVSAAGHVWGVTSSGAIYRRVGANKKTPAGSSWKRITGALTQISVGKAGVWGVNSNNDVYYREGTSEDVDTDGSTWTQVGTMKIKYITSGPGCVRAVNLNNNIFYRGGMSLGSPTGYNWVQLNSPQLKMLEIYDAVNGMWGLTHDGVINANKFY